MTREERNTIAHKIAWEYTKHYDPLLSKESWCEMAARDAIDWFDQHPRKGLWDAEKVVEWILNNYETYEQTYSDNSGNHTYSDFQIGQFIRNLREAMED